MCLCFTDTQRACVFVEVLVCDHGFHESELRLKNNYLMIMLTPSLLSAMRVNISVGLI